MEILFVQLIVSQQLSFFNVFWYNAAGVRTHDLPVVRQTLYWLCFQYDLDIQ